MFPVPASLFSHSSHSPHHPSCLPSDPLSLKFHKNHSIFRSYWFCETILQPQRYPRGHGVDTKPGSLQWCPDFSSCLLFIAIFKKNLWWVPHSLHHCPAHKPSEHPHWPYIECRGLLSGQWVQRWWRWTLIRIASLSLFTLKLICGIFSANWGLQDDQTWKKNTNIKCLGQYKLLVSRVNECLSLHS